MLSTKLHCIKFTGGLTLVLVVGCSSTIGSGSASINLHFVVQEKQSQTPVSKAVVRLYDLSKGSREFVVSGDEESLVRETVTNKDGNGNFSYKFPTSTETNAVHKVSRVIFSPPYWLEIILPSGTHKLMPLSDVTGTAIQFPQDNEYHFIIEIAK